jgi:4-amino-4-deoxy-L-arabinose transferase-like glycosyltransferase
MTIRHPLAVVLMASIACLAVGFTATPFWDEDEPRFAAIAKAMVDSGDWIVPMYNDTLAVDKPVLMHWCMAVAFTLFGAAEIPARLPAALATLATALALLRAGTRWFDPATGVVAALAFVGCLLVGIESHAATPDAILVALTTWSTVLAAEAFLPDRSRGGQADGPRLNELPALGRLTVARAGMIGGLTGLAVLCKGPVGFVGPLVVVVFWAWCVAMEQRFRRPSASGSSTGRLLAAAVPAAWDAIRCLRPAVIAAAMLAVAAPWYVAVSLRTNGAWTAGFFLVHNVGRFVAPMEKHSGGFLFHPVAMLVGFYPWSCFLPLAIAVAGWRVWRRVDPPAVGRTLLLMLVWITVWVGAFSAAATKLPNYVLPAYPAAALLVAALGVEAARRPRWVHPRWMASGVVSLALGGVAVAATVLAATFFGLSGAEPAALVGIVPIVGAVACVWAARRSLPQAVAALTITGLVFTALTVGPASRWIANANALPTLVRQAHDHAGGRARIGVYTQNTPNIVFYAGGHVGDWIRGQTDQALAFLGSGDDAVLIVPEHRFEDLAASLPAGCGIIGRARPMFGKHDSLLVGTRSPGSEAASTPRSAAADTSSGSTTR